MTTAIHLENLSKVFGRRKQIRAVDNINLKVESGQVYGFLGPNGAGKTTTIRMILDLMSPTTGSAYIYDRHVHRNHDVLRRVGAVVEGAAFYPYLSGWKNLEVLARTDGRFDRKRIDELLELVGLAERGGQRFSKYSMGMKQRLGLAGALLHDPELVILDEPANGLDPAGIQWMRFFIRDLVHKHGKTVFLSSHQLSEVEQTCDRVAIIDKGRVLREGDVAGLLGEQPRVCISANPLDKAVMVLADHWTVKPNQTNTEMMIDTPHEDIPHIVRKLVEHGIDVHEVTRSKQSLEDFFLSVTGNNHVE